MASCRPQDPKTLRATPVFTAPSCKQPHWFGFLPSTWDQNSNLFRNGAGPGLPFNLLNAEKCGRGQDASLGPRLNAAASIYTHVSSASEKDDPQGIKECGNKPCWKPQLLAKKPSPLHFFKPLGRIIFIFTTALKKHSRKETKAKREQRPRIIL